ncbi:hypothetical protein BGX24_005953 [Mortierella sp. AD032]|nr:hypothetical protein BGX24_005953 [Mortierella sp. AD032]
MARCMRDSWNLQIRSIAREAMPPTGLSVFGSTSFGDETKFYAMDFAGTISPSTMLLPVTKVFGIIAFLMVANTVVAVPVPTTDVRTTDVRTTLRLASAFDDPPN